MGDHIMKNNIKFPQMTVGNLILLLILLVATFVSKIVSIPFMLGVSFSISSIFLLIILRLYGFRIAFLTAVLVHSLSVAVAGFLFYDIVFLLEIISVSLLAIVLRRGNLVIWDLLFWLLIGAPISMFLHHIQFAEIAESVLNFKITIEVLNGLVNALIADLLLAYVPFHMLMKKRKDKKNNGFHFYQILFHLSIVAIVFPFLINTGINHWDTHQTELSNSKQLAVGAANGFEQELQKWTNEDLERLKLKGLIQIGYINEMVREYTSEEGLELVVLDERHRVISSSDPNSPFVNDIGWIEQTEVTLLPNDIYRVLPNNENMNIGNWTNGHYIYKRTIAAENITLLVMFPITTYQERLINDYFSQLNYLLIFISCAIFLAFLTNRLLVSTVNNLASTTTGLPQRLKQRSSIEWPSSKVLEFSSLITNFKHMSDELFVMFRESEEMNDQLKQQAWKLKKSEESLHSYAYYDTLTGLPNRLQFHDTLTALIEESHVTKSTFAVVFVDLNQFKQINDTLGHAAGDELLRMVSKNLRKLSSDSTSVFRLGGDEFTLIVKGTTKADMYQFGKEIEAVFSEAIELKGITLYVSGSVGVSMFPDNGEDVDTLVKFADMAMYSSKELSGSPIQFFDQSMQEDFKERMLVENGLRSALRENQLELHYQPKVNASTGVVTSIEALMRWTHPVLGRVAPDKFIKVAEEIGLIYEIDNWGVLEACRQMKQLQEEGLRCIPVSVNISAKHFHQEQIIDILDTALKQTGLDPSFLQIEITESVFNKDVEGVISIMKRIQKMGIRVSIDDFGIGYSSLNQLINLPIHEVKLDRQFIKDIHKKDKQASIVSLIVELAHSLGLNVVAEGVEVAEELIYLKQLQCDELQGYYFSQPLAIDRIRDYLIKADQNQSRDNNGDLL